MRMAAAVLLAISGTILAQPNPATLPGSEPAVEPAAGPSANPPVGPTSEPAIGTVDSGAAQPAGTVQEPDRRLEPAAQPLPQGQQPAGGPIGGPIQETGNYGNLGAGSPAGNDVQRSPGQVDHRGTGQQGPSSLERR